MKKIISIMAAGVLLLSSVSALAFDDFIDENAKVITDFNKIELTSGNGNTLPAGVPVFKSQKSNPGSGFKLDNTGSISSINIVEVGENNRAMEIKTTGSGVLIGFAQWSGSNTIRRVSADIMIKDNGGVRFIYNGQQAPWSSDDVLPSFNCDRNLVSFSNITDGSDSGDITVYGYSNGNIKAKWQKNTWYNVQIKYEAPAVGHTGTTDLMVEIRKGGASGELVGSWIAAAPAGTAITAASQGLFKISAESATTFVVDNHKIYVSTNDAPVAEVYNYVVNGTPVYSISDMQGKTVNVELSTLNKGLSVASPKMFVASYDGEDRLLNVSLGNANIEDVTLSLAELAVPANAAKIKTFIWDENMAPVLVDIVE